MCNKRARRDCDKVQRYTNHSEVIKRAVSHITCNGARQYKYIVNPIATKTVCASDTIIEHGCNLTLNSTPTLLLNFAFVDIINGPNTNHMTYFIAFKQHNGWAFIFSSLCYINYVKYGEGINNKQHSKTINLHCYKFGAFVYKKKMALRNSSQVAIPEIFTFPKIPNLFSSHIRFVYIYTVW